MKVLLFTFLLITLAFSTKWHELETYTFEDYVIEFAKSYEAVEFEYRRAVFEAKL